MEKFYCIAGMRIAISVPDDVMYEDDGVLFPFRISDENWDYKFIMKIVSELPFPEGECVFRDASKRIYRKEDKEIRYIGAVEQSLNGAYLYIARSDKESFVQIKKQVWGNAITPKVVLNALSAEHLVTENHGFILHSSYICVDGTGIVFTAPSGTGKSTQADLWQKLRDAEIINGDRSVIKVEEDGVFVYGIPFSGSSGIGKKKRCPLKAIVYLAQAPKTTISPLTGVRAFRRIWEGCSVNTWNREDVSMCTQTVMDVIHQVPIFYMPCTPDESAILALEQVLEMR